MTSYSNSQIVEATQQSSKMEWFGIEFAPLNIPLTRRLQTLASASFFFTFIFGSIICFFITIYILIFTTYLRWPMLLYLIWINLIENKIGERGGRPSEWVRNWSWWKYLKDYYPLTLEKVDGVHLEPSKNYLFCCFPHGIMATGPFSAFGTNYGGFSEWFPHHTPHVHTLKLHFQAPFFRELALGLGGLDSSKQSLNYTLGKPGGGKVSVLMVGGAAEALYCRPGDYRVILKKRKGFVKLALKNGAPLVPVISFGENDLYDQAANPNGSRVRQFQEAVKKWAGMAPAIPIGRGFFQYSFGVIARRRPVTTLIGKPIDVEKVEDPTSEQIDALHSLFMKELTHLFESEKHRYLKNHENVRLVIE